MIYHISPKVDDTTGVVMIIDYIHHETHEGNSFVVKKVNDLTINNVSDIQIVTPNTNKKLHMRFAVECEAETNWWIYEGVSIETQGTELTSINRNRNSDNTSAASIYQILNASIGDANADTDISSAILIASGIAGSGKSNVDVDASYHEYILKKDTTYSFRYEAAAAGYIDLTLNWYEHANV